MVAFILLIYSFLCCYGQSLLPALCMWPTDFSDSRGLLARILQSVAVFSLARQFMVWRDNKSRWYVALFMEAAFKNNSKLALLTKGIKKPTNQMQQTCLITCEECDFSLVHEKPWRVEGVGWGVEVLLPAIKTTTKFLVAEVCFFKLKISLLHLKY